MAKVPTGAIRNARQHLSIKLQASSINDTLQGLLNVGLCDGIEADMSCTCSIYCCSDLLQELAQSQHAGQSAISAYELCTGLHEHKLKVGI